MSLSQFFAQNDIDPCWKTYQVGYLIRGQDRVEWVCNRGIKSYAVLSGEIWKSRTGKLVYRAHPEYPSHSQPSAEYLAECYSQILGA